MVIPPEVVDDSFSDAIRRFVAEPDVRVVLEIGSSDGSGSTRSIVDSLSKKNEKELHCLELSQPRFRVLEERYRDLPWVHCWNLPSVDPRRMPTPNDVARFYHEELDSPIRNNRLKEVQRWLRQDLEYIERNEWADTGLDAARRSAGVEYFDLILIDGSEFTGEAELDELYGATFVLLDDVRTYKNLANYRRLQADQQYELVAQDLSCRNGFAAFRRTTRPLLFDG
jgi:hypothetical protein